MKFEYFSSANTYEEINHFIKSCVELWELGFITPAIEIINGAIIGSGCYINNELISFHFMDKGEFSVICEWNKFNNTSIDDMETENNGNDYWGGISLFTVGSYRRKKYAQKLILSTLKHFSIDIENYGVSNSLEQDGLNFFRNTFPKYRRILN